MTKPTKLFLEQKQGSFRCYNLIPNPFTHSLLVWPRHCNPLWVILRSGGHQACSGFCFPPTPRHRLLLGGGAPCQGSGPHNDFVLAGQLLIISRKHFAFKSHSLSTKISQCQETLNSRVRLASNGLSLVGLPIALTGFVHLAQRYEFLFSARCQAWRGGGMGRGETRFLSSTSPLPRRGVHEFKS